MTPPCPPGQATGDLGPTGAGDIWEAVEPRLTRTGIHGWGPARWGGRRRRGVGPGRARLCKLRPLRWSGDFRLPVLGSAHALGHPAPMQGPQLLLRIGFGDLRSLSNAQNNSAAGAHRCASCLPPGFPGPEAVVGKATPLFPSRQERTDQESSHGPLGRALCGQSLPAPCG